MDREPTFDEKISFHFTNLVMQTGNMAMMFLGKIAHPETGKAEVDLDAARMFIDQLEMLAIKTRGNLSSPEQKALGDMLTSLRFMFVEEAHAAEQKQAPAAPKEPKAAEAPPSAPTETSAEQKPAPDDESKKKFVKKY